jgi:hypothetical protein
MDARDVDQAMIRLQEELEQHIEQVEAPPEELRQRVRDMFTER